MGPTKPKSTVLSPAEEAVFVEFRRRTLLPLDDVMSAGLAGQLLRDICARQSIRPGQLTVHSDNVAPMKGETMLAAMQRLGVVHTRSRPAVSNDNPMSNRRSQP